MAVLAMAAMSVKAQDSVFSYTHQGTTLYYIIDSTGDAMLVPPMWPEYDEENDETWLGYTKPVGVVTVPDSVSFAGSNYAVTRVGHDAFYKCAEVTSVTLPAAVTALGMYAFGKCFSLTAFTIPEGVTYIPDCCFFMDTVLTSVNIPTGVASIGDYAFYECCSLQGISIPGNVKAIGSYAFAKCHSLQEISIPGSVNAIGFWTFGHCRNLASVVLSEGVDTIGYASFSRCVNLSHIVIPTTLKAICDFAFQYDSALCIDLVLPEGFTTMGPIAFGDCVSLPSVTLPGTMTEVPDHAFRQCNSLATATLGEGMTTIGESVFVGCNTLNKVIIPSTMDSIRSWAFYDGEPDTIVLRCAVPPALGNSVFSNYHSILVVPCGSESAYRQHPVWGRFQNIIENCNGINDAEVNDIKVYAHGGRIVVEGAEGESVQVFDVTGRPINPKQETIGTGVYLVKVGTHHTKKVVVIK